MGNGRFQSITDDETPRNDRDTNDWDEDMNSHLEKNEHHITSNHQSTSILLNIASPTTETSTVRGHPLQIPYDDLNEKTLVNEPQVIGLGLQNVPLLDDSHYQAQEARILPSPIPNHSVPVSVTVATPNETSNSHYDIPSTNLSQSSSLSQPEPSPTQELEIQHQKLYTFSGLNLVCD